MAEIYTLGLLKMKPNHHQFKRVTQKQFWAGLSLFQHPLTIDTRLSETHQLVNYYIPEKYMRTWRTWGLRTPQIAYIHKNDYILHEHILNATERFPILFSKDENEIKKSLPELLEILGCPPSRKKYFPDTPAS